MLGLFFALPSPPSCVVFCFFFLLAAFIPEQVPLQPGHPVVKIYVGILFLLNLPISLCGLQIEVKGITGGYVSGLAHGSHASVIWAVVKPGNTMVLSSTYEEKAKHKGELTSSVKQNKKLE